MGIHLVNQPSHCLSGNRASWWLTLISSLTLICTCSSMTIASDLQLSLREALQMALSSEGNRAVQIAAELVRETQARSAGSRAVLLPNLEASIGQQSQTRNLEALGLRPQPNFRPPALVGPFATFDARATLTQSIFDISSMRRYQASKAAVLVAETEKASTEDQIAAEVARAYLEALRNKARLEAATANVDLAEALLKLAQNQKAAGMGTGIEVTRAEVQLSNEQQLLLAAQYQYRQSLLRLLEQIGANLDERLVLTDSLRYLPAEVAGLQQAMEIAFQSRSDLQAQLKREQQVHLNYRAARLERFPSILGFADYGTIGTRITAAVPTWTLGISLQLPVFDGGQIDARRAEEMSKLRQERIRSEELHRQIELQVRLALDGLYLTEEQIQVAQEGLQLAQQELEQGRRRYQAGITTNLEVTDAQTRLERAKENHINALFHYNLERVNLGEAMGTIRSMF